MSQENEGRVSLTQQLNIDLMASLLNIAVEKGISSSELIEDVLQNFADHEDFKKSQKTGAKTRLEKAEQIRIQTYRFATERLKLDENTANIVSHIAASNT